jgi:hypothetical protein
MKTILMRSAALAAAITMAGCANTAEYMRSRPSTYFQVDPQGERTAEAPRTDGAAVAAPVPDRLPQVSLRCTQAQDLAIKTPDGKNQQECLYVSADVTTLVSTPGTPEQTEEAIDFLIGVSDMNCSNYLHRVFANKAGMDFTDNLVANLTTSAATATAHIDPTVSAALGVANLVVGNSMDAFNSTYFMDKTFQALEAAINAERQRIKAIIIAKRATANSQSVTRRYGLVQALSDLRAYDDACSFKAGLNALVSIAESEQAERTRTTLSLDVSPDQAAKARELYRHDIRPKDDLPRGQRP